MAPTTEMRKRRGKKDTNALPTKQPADDTTTAKRGNGGPSLEDQLERAQGMIELNRMGTALIHDQWRSQLRRFSYVILLMSVYQTYLPAAFCFENVTAFQQQASSPLSPIQTALLIAADSAVYMVAIATSILLILFLHSSNRSFANPFFMLANACIPVILALRHSENSNNNDDSVSNQTSPSCLTRNLFWKISGNLEQQQQQQQQQGPPGSVRGFPVVLIFNVIVALCYWYIGQQASQIERNLQAVVKVRENLTRKRDRAQQAKNGSSRDSTTSKEADNDKNQ